MVLMIAVPALVFVAIVAIAIMGDAFQKRTESVNAADAAALAAAEQWRSYVVDKVDAADGRDSSAALPQLKQILDLNAATIDRAAVESRAMTLANKNGAELYSLTKQRVGNYMEFTAVTRNLDAVNGTTAKPTATATVRVEFSGSICWASNSRLGLRYGNVCRGWSSLQNKIEDDTRQPEAPPATEENPTPTPPPAPKVKIHASFDASIIMAA